MTLHNSHTADGFSRSFWLPWSEHPSSSKKEPKVPNPTMSMSQGTCVGCALVCVVSLDHTLEWWWGCHGLPLAAPPSVQSYLKRSPWNSTSKLNFTSALVCTSGKCLTLVILQPFLLPGCATSPWGWKALPGSPYTQFHWNSCHHRASCSSFTVQAGDRHHPFHSPLGSPSSAPLNTLLTRMPKKPLSSLESWPVHQPWRPVEFP